MGDIVLKFRGAEYRLPESRCFEVGDEIEDVATLFEISPWKTNPHVHKLARCVGIILRAAGAKVTDREVKTELVASITGGAKDGYLHGCLYAVIAVMFDGAPAADEGGEPGEPEPAS